MGEFSWAYIDADALVSASGPTGSVQFRVGDAGGRSAISGTENFIYHTASSLLAVTGNVEISGTLTANEYNINVVDKTVTNISASGNTKFGDTSDDTHQFTGSIFSNGNVTLGDAASDVATINAQLTASSQVRVAGALTAANNFTVLQDTQLGNAVDNSITVKGTTTHESNVLIQDNKTLLFGTNSDASIKYDEEISDRLIISGSTAGTNITGNVHIADDLFVCGTIAACSPLKFSGSFIELTGAIMYSRTIDDLSFPSSSNESSVTGSTIIGASGSVRINPTLQNVFLVTGSSTFTGSASGSAPCVVVSGSVQISSSSPALTITSGDLIVSGSSFLGQDCTDNTLIRSRLTGNCGMLIPDDKRLLFGSDTDSYISYDEATQNRLIISGSAIGLSIGGGSIALDYGAGKAINSGTLAGPGSFIGLAADNTLVLASSAITIDNDSNNRITTAKGDGSLNAEANLTFDGNKLTTVGQISASLGITGSTVEAQSIDVAGGDGALNFSAAGQNSIKIPDDQSAALVIEEADNAYMTFVTTDGGERILVANDIQMSDDTKIFFGTNDDALIEYDEAAINRLIISGSAAGTDITGNVHIAHDLFVCGTIAACSPLKFSGSNIQFTGSTTIGSDCNDSTLILSQLTGNCGMLIPDDKSLLFGSDRDAFIKYDEAAINRLIISATGSAQGMDISGSTFFASEVTFEDDVTCNDSLTLAAGDGALNFSVAGQNSIKIPDAQAVALTIEEANNAYLTFVTTDDAEKVVFDVDAKIKDDKELIFGNNNDASIEYQESTTNRLVISGSAAGIDITGSIEFQHEATFIDDVEFRDDVKVVDNKNIIFGTNNDSIIQYDETTQNRLIISGSATGLSIGGGSIALDYGAGKAINSGTAGGPGSFLALASNNTLVLASPSASPAGSDTEIQFNNGGSFGASSNFTLENNDELTMRGTFDVFSGSGAGGTKVFSVEESDGSTRGRMVQTIMSQFDLTSGAQAKAGRFISIGGNRATVNNSLSRLNGMLTPFSGRLISITYHFPAGASVQDQSKGNPQFALFVANVNQLNGNTFAAAAVETSMCTASTWPGTNHVGGINVQNGQGTIGSAHTTGSWSFGTGSAVGLFFRSGDDTGNNYPGQAAITTVWEFDQLDPFVSGSGN